MTDKLPSNLLQLFAPRPQLRYLPHIDAAPEARTTHAISGVAAFLPALKEEPIDYEPTESWLQKQQRELYEKKQAAEKLLNVDFKDCTFALVSNATKS